jgi:hypothetical protein
VSTGITAPRAGRVGNQMHIIPPRSRAARGPRGAELRGKISAYYRPGYRTML